MKIAYTVRCAFTTEQVAQGWMDWLKDEHLGDVCRAGATSGEGVWLDAQDLPEGQVVCEARYIFESREVFDLYLEQHAPRLRQEGLDKFPLDLGLTYSRSVGEIHSSYSVH